nr:FkbM family methyltransferase [Singulisphaera sp. GP187]
MTAPLVLGRGLQVVRSVSGLKLMLDPCAYTGCMMFYGRYSTEILRLLKMTVGEGDRVLDVGTQLGYITSHLAQWVGPNGGVYSFEADPRAVEQLRTTVRENRFDWVKVFPIAASDREGSISFNVSPVLGWSTAVNGTHLTGLTTIEVPCSRIDDLVNAGEIRRPIRLIKIDVEGSECAVLDGMRQLIAEDRPFVLTEINPDMLRPSGLSSRDLLGRLQPFGYRFYRVYQPQGILGGGETAFAEVDPASELEACDVFCAPEGTPLSSALQTLVDRAKHA